MRTLYIEGLAIHGGPESCVGDPRGRSEALIGVRAGSVIEPRNQGFRGADVVNRGGRQHRWPRYREWPVDPARSEIRCMHVKAPGARTGRSRGRPCPLMMPRPGWFAGGRSAGGGPRGERQWR
jgi:hypothetical protein